MKKPKIKIQRNQKYAKSGRRRKAPPKIDAELFEQNVFETFDGDLLAAGADRSKQNSGQVGNENGRDESESKSDPDIQIVSHVIDLFVFDRIADLL